MKKGIRTSIVSFLETIRSTLSQYSSSVPANYSVQRIIESEKLAKYIETPMLEIQSTVWNGLNENMKSSNITIILTGILFLLVLLFCWRLAWVSYLDSINIKIWSTKGLLNLIPIRIVKFSDKLKE